MSIGSVSNNNNNKTTQLNRNKLQSGNQLVWFLVRKCVILSRDCWSWWLGQPITTKTCDQLCTMGGSPIYKEVKTVKQHFASTCCNKGDMRVLVLFVCLSVSCLAQRPQRCSKDLKHFISSFLGLHIHKHICCSCMYRPMTECS